MSKSEQDVEAARQWHKTFAIETNHLVWSLLGKTKRTAREASEQIQNVEPEDKEIFSGDFESGPWYGMK